MNVQAMMSAAFLEILREEQASFAVHIGKVVIPRGTAVVVESCRAERGSFFVVGIKEPGEAAEVPLKTEPWAGNDADVGTEVAPATTYLRQYDMAFLRHGGRAVPESVEVAVVLVELHTQSHAEVRAHRDGLVEVVDDVDAGVLAERHRCPAKRRPTARVAEQIALERDVVAEDVPEEITDRCRDGGLVAAIPETFDDDRAVAEHRVLVGLFAGPIEREPEAVDDARAIDVEEAQSLARLNLRDAAAVRLLEIVPDRANALLEAERHFFVGL